MDFAFNESGAALPRSLPANVQLRRELAFAFQNAHSKAGPSSEGPSHLLKHKFRNVASNIKVFSKGAESYYTRRIEERLSSSFPTFQFFLSTEEPDAYGHDLVGFLKILQTHTDKVIGHSISPDSNSPMHVILDGGMKSRNFALTLFNAYQGLYSLMTQTAWENTLLTSTSLTAQLPNGGQGWCLLSASDYDLVPSDVTVGRNNHLSSLPSVADLVFFTSPLPVETDRHIRASISLLLDRCPSFYSLSNPEALSVVASMPASASINWYFLAEELRRLSTKGIVLADVETGRMLDFREKPSVCELYKLFARGTIQENVMYNAIKQSHLAPLLSAFTSIRSECDPTHALADAIPFGFYSTLAASPFMSSEEWDKEWLKSLPPVSQLDSRPKFEADKWTADGRSVREIAISFMREKQVYVASLGSDAIVEDLGEPRYYLSAMISRAFNDFGLERSLLEGPQKIAENIISVSSTISLPVDNVSIDSSSKLFLSSSAIKGSGILRILNGARVILSNTILDIPKECVVTIGSDSQPGNADNAVAFESCNISSPMSISTPRALFVGFDSSSSSCSSLIEVSTPDVLVTVSLQPAASDSMSMKRVLVRFSLDKVANAKAPEFDGKRLLDMPVVGGLNFFQALRKLNVKDLVERQSLIKSSISNKS